MPEHENDLLVSMDVVSTSATIGQLSTALGIEPTLAISHERGTRRAGGGIWSMTTWRLDSGCPRKSPIADHIRALLEIFPIDNLGSTSQLPREVKIVLNIGVMAPSFCDTLDIPSEYLKRVGEAGIELSIAVYAPRGDQDEK